MSKWLDPISDAQNRFLSCLLQGEESLSRQDTAAAAKAIQDAGRLLGSLSDLIFREFHSAVPLDRFCSDAASNPDNALYCQEIFHAQHLSYYSRREVFLSGALQARLDRLVGLHAKAVSKEKLLSGDAPGALEGLVEVVRTDSALCGPLGSALKAVANAGGADFIRFDLERVVHHPGFRNPWGIALAAGTILVAGLNGGVDVLDHSGEHLGRHEMDLLRPVGCPSPQDRAAFFINSDSRLVKVSPENGLLAQTSLRDALDLPAQALFTGAAHHQGLTYCPCHALDPDILQTCAAVWDERTGTVSLAPLPGQGTPFASAGAQGINLTDAMHFTVSRLDAPEAPLFRFDPLLLPMHVKGYAQGGGMHFIHDATTLLAFSGSGRLLGRIRPGGFIGRLTEITGLAVSGDGSRLYVLDWYNKCLFILNATIAWAGESAEGHS